MVGTVSIHIHISRCRFHIYRNEVRQQKMDFGGHYL